MDIQVRYWDYDIRQVRTRYLDSRFFRRPNADNIKDELILGMKGLSEDKMLSMDGPKTNWSVLDKIKEHREGIEVPPLGEVSSRGLHVVHGAFQME